MSTKPKAILMGPIIGEFGWCLQRFAPILPYLINKKYRKQDIKYIILTRKDRFDLYGRYASIFLPLNIPGDYDKYLPNCYRLNGFPIKEYEKIARSFYKKYSKNYNIIEHIYPKIDKRNFVNKNQFSSKQMIFNFKPRKENYELIENYLSKNNNPIVILSPRYRKGFQRNWNQWPQFFDMIWESDLQKQFNFIICGKPGEYIPDLKNRFQDINNIQLGENSSLAGLLISVLQKSIFTCGSQSGIPNLSLLLKVPVLEWGHQKSLHTKTYNIKNTKITFLEDRKYNLSFKKVFKHLNNELKKRR